MILRTGVRAAATRTMGVVQTFPGTPALFYSRNAPVTDIFVYGLSATDATCLLASMGMSYW